MRILVLVMLFLFPKVVLSQNIKFYVADEISHSEKIIGVDACDLDPYSEGEKPSDSPVKKPDQLFILTDSGPMPLRFQNIKKKTYPICDSNIPRNIWLWKSTVPIKSIPLLTDSKEVQFKLFNTQFKSYQITPYDLAKMNSIDKRWRSKDSFKSCSAYKWEQFLRFDCRYSAYMFKDYKLLHEASDTEKDPFINLIGTVNLQNEEYYVIAFYNDPSRPLKDTDPFILKNSSGKRLAPEGCYLPSRC